MTAPRQREPRAGFDLRLLRATVFTAACVALSAAGHGLASGAPVPVWSLLAGFAAMLVVAVPLAGRPRSLPGIAGSLAVGQIVLHMVFGIGQHDMAMPRSGDPGSLLADAARLVCGAGAATLNPAQAHRLLVDAHMAPSTQPVAHGADVMSTTGGIPLPFVDSAVPMLPSLPMLLGHVLAAVAAGWLLRRGDLALFRLVALSAQGVAEATLVRALRAALALVRALRAGLPGSGRTGPCPPRMAMLEPPMPRPRPFQHSVVRRGPPATLRTV